MNIGEMLIKLEKRMSVIEVVLGIKPDKDLLLHPKSFSQAIAKTKAEAEKLEKPK